MKKRIWLLVVGILLLLLLAGKYVYENINQEEKPFEEEQQKPSKEEYNGETIKNILVIEKKNQNITILLDNAEQTFQYEGELLDDLSLEICDVTIENETVTNIVLKKDVIRDRVAIIEEDYVEFDKNGRLLLSEDYKIYNLIGKPKQVEEGILVGYATTDFVMEGDKICAALIREEVVADNICVLIKTTGYSSLYHEQVILTSDSPFTLTYGGKKKKQKKYKANEKITIKKNSSLLKTGRIKIETSKKEAKITILSIKRNEVSPSYRGSMEIAKKAQGLILVNELSLEEYLYAVLPSEMPSSYHKEALKTQAICARSYAYNQLLNNALSQYGAHVDDSTNYQVYNNIPETEESIQAVKDTYGMVLQYGKEIILAYYFSTSCGSTSSASQVWLSNTKDNYLGGKGQFISKKENKKLNLSSEEDFYNFILSDKRKTYDSDFPWYRWRTTISYKKISHYINTNLASRIKANPSLILVRNELDEYVPKEISSVGDVYQILIGKREKSGLVTELIIKGTKYLIKVKSEYNIRMLLAPTDSTIIRQDNSKIDGMSILPSAYFTTAEVKGGSGIKFYGGGYGHGVGMSQNGAKTMAEQGKKYNEILEHYYSGTKIGYIY